MANAAGMIYESIWRDQDWRRLSIRAQRLYMQLLSQKELDCAGMLPLQPDKWATGCDEYAVAQVWEDLDELQAARFVYYDTATYEAFIRTYIRNSNVMKVPNMRKSACRSALLVGSESIKPVLAAELRATGDPNCFAAAEEINPWPTLPEPFANPSEINPSGTLPEPTGVGKGKGVSHLSSNSGGEGRPKCSKHPNGTDDPCRGCARVREWDEANAAAVQADELEAKRRARDYADNCPTCEGTNWVPDTDPAVKCNHERTTTA